MAEVTVPDYEDLLLDSLQLSAPAQVNRSQWTGKRKVVGLAGPELWRGKATIDLLTTDDQERPWRAFLFGLKGPQNWFKWPLPWNSHIGPKPTVGASPGDGYTLPLTGMTKGARLKAGSYLTVPLPSGHSRAVCLLATLTADASGNATAAFTPALGEVPTVGATVETTRPFIPMSLVDPEQGFGLSDGVSGATFDVEEAR